MRAPWGPHPAEIEALRRAEQSVAHWPTVLGWQAMSRYHEACVVKEAQMIVYLQERIELRREQELAHARRWLVSTLNYRTVYPGSVLP